MSLALLTKDKDKSSEKLHKVIRLPVPTTYTVELSPLGYEGAIPIIIDEERKYTSIIEQYIGDTQYQAPTYTGDVPGGEPRMADDRENQLHDKWLDERFTNVAQQYQCLKESQQELREDFRAAVADIKAENRNLVNMINVTVQALDTKVGALNNKIEALNVKVSDSQSTLIKWMVTLVVATLAAGVGVANIVVRVLDK